MDFMIETGWIEAARLFIQAIYEKPRTSFDNRLQLLCNNLSCGVLLLDDVDAPIQWLLASHPGLPTSERTVVGAGTY